MVRKVRWVVLQLGLVLTAGCAGFEKARLYQWDPDSAGAAGIKTVSLSVTAPKNLGPAFTDCLQVQLPRSGRLVVVEQTHETKADAVLEAKIITLETQSTADRPSDPRDKAAVHEPPLHEPAVKWLRWAYDTISNGLQMESGKAVAHFRLLDRNGNIFMDRTVEVALPSGMRWKGDGASNTSRTKGERIAVLLDLMATRLVEHVENPGKRPTDLLLAVGNSQVAVGVRLAQAGNVEGARNCWRQVLNQDKNNHAALYNLGVIHEYLGELDEARRCLQQAIQWGNSPVYVDVLARVNRAGPPAVRGQMP